ncbi:hypothetical protein LINGRAHAP2_LOCUS8004 [Linum grandiflorum]
MLSDERAQQDLEDRDPPEDLVAAATATHATVDSTNKPAPYHYRLLIVDLGGLRKTLDMKYSEHRDIVAAGNKIVLTMSNQNVRPAGDLLSFISSYIGECSWNYAYYPITPVDWKKMLPQVKTRAWEQFVLTTFYIELDEMADARRYWDERVGRSWSWSRLRAWRDRLKNVEKENLPAEWILANPPTGCPQADWIAYLERVNKEEYNTLVKSNNANRRLQLENHRGGRRPWDRYIEETLQMTGRRPSRGQLFQHFFKWPDGSYKSEHARMVAATITRLEAAGAPTEWGPNDSLAQALNNPEHRGHVRMLGLGFTQTRAWGHAASSSASATTGATIGSSSAATTESDPPPTQEEVNMINNQMVVMQRQMETMYSYMSQQIAGVPNPSFHPPFAYGYPPELAGAGTASTLVPIVGGGSGTQSIPETQSVPQTPFDPTYPGLYYQPAPAA